MMKLPSKVIRGLFIASIGFLFVGVLFTMLSWPAAGLFTVLGSGASAFFYVWFNMVSTKSNNSAFARHVALGAFVVGQLLKVWDVSAAPYFLLVALVAFLVWTVWSVLAELPPTED